MPIGQLPISVYTQHLEITIQLSLSLNLTTLDISRNWNHKVFCPFEIGCHLASCSQGSSMLPECPSISGWIISCHMYIHPLFFHSPMDPLPWLLWVIVSNGHGCSESSSIPCFQFFGGSVQFSHSVVSDSLRPHELQHARLPCPSPPPRVHPNSCALSQWCHPAISSSVFPFSSCPQSLPGSGSFPMSQLFAWGGHSIGV